jgi:hypothetical protein
MDIESFIGTTSTIPTSTPNQPIFFFTNAVDRLKGIKGFSETEFNIILIISNILDALLNFFIKNDGEKIFISLSILLVTITLAMIGGTIGCVFYFLKPNKKQYKSVEEESVYASVLDDLLKPSAPPYRNGNFDNNNFIFLNNAKI